MQPLSQDTQRRLTRTKSDRGRLHQRPGARSHESGCGGRYGWLAASFGADDDDGAPRWVKVSAAVAVVLVVVFVIVHLAGGGMHEHTQ